MSPGDRDHPLTLLLLLVQVAVACGSDSSSAPIQGSTLAFDTIATGLSAPVFMTAPPGDASVVHVLARVS